MVFIVYLPRCCASCFTPEGCSNEACSCHYGSGESQQPELPGMEPAEFTQSLGMEIAALSEWVDMYPPNATRDAEAQAWGRLSKISEEVGEAVAAFVGATNQNPRKGHTHGPDAVQKELLDVALTALCAYEHFTGNRGTSMVAFFAHTLKVSRRRFQ